jgi:tetratricopeptide (TPR) repeat protein
VFRQAQTRFPNLPEAHYFLGVAARSRGDYSLAENEFRKTLSLEPDNVNALAQLGFIVGERDRYSEAEQLLRRAIAINNKHFYAYYDLGRLLAKSRKYESALPLLQQASMLKPGIASVHYQLFIALSRLQRKDDAEREFTLFKRLDNERKARGEDDEEIDESPVENNSAPAPPISP